MAHNYARKSMLSISGPVGRRKREAFGNIPNVNVNTPYPIGPNSPVPINHIVPNYSIPTNEVFFYCMMCLLRVVVVVVVVVVVCVVDVPVEKYCCAIESSSSTSSTTTPGMIKHKRVV